MARAKLTPKQLAQAKRIAEEKVAKAVATVRRLEHSKPPEVGPTIH